MIRRTRPGRAAVRCSEGEGQRRGASTRVLERVATQTWLRLAGEVPDGSTCVASLHDSDARSSVSKHRQWTTPMASSSITTSCGESAGCTDAAAGHGPHRGALGPGRNLPLTADRGHGEAAVDTGLEALAVKKVVIPRRGKPGGACREEQRARSFPKPGEAGAPARGPGSHG